MSCFCTASAAEKISQPNAPRRMHRAKQPLANRAAKYRLQKLVTMVARDPTHRHDQ